MHLDNFNVSDFKTQPPVFGASYVTPDMYRDFQKDNNKKRASDKDLGLGHVEFVSDNGDGALKGIADYVSDIGALLKGDLAPEEASAKVMEYLTKNADSMYTAAELQSPSDPLKYIADQLHNSLDDRYVASKQERAGALSITDQNADMMIALIKMGPNIDDWTHAPKGN